MNRELKRKGIISIAVHVTLILFLIIRSFISCHRVDTRNISPFLDLQMGGGAPKGGGGGAAELAVNKKDDAFPELAKKNKGVDPSKKLVKKTINKPPPKKQLTENEIKKLLSEGIANSGPPLPGAGPGTGAGGGSTVPFAWYYYQIKMAMYEAWQQPSALTGSKGLMTTAEVRVQRDGQVTSRRITVPSGNTQMDDSVRRALDAITQLPPLPAGLGGFYKDISIDFELTDMALPSGE